MRTMEEIYAAMAEDFSARSSVALIEGGDMSLRLWAMAAEVFALEVQADFVLRQSFPQTAVGGYLDMHAQERGLTRGAAEKAHGTLRFYLDEERTADLSVPAGTVCMSVSGAEFVSAEPGIIPAGETYCDVAAEAVDAGAGGNIPALAIRYIELPPSGISGVTNTQAFSGGCSAETDEELRSRVLASYRALPNGANKAYYESRVLGVSGVESVTVIPKARGLGTVDVYFATQSGIPDAGMVTAVQDLLDGEREICVDIEVSAPTPVTVNVAAVVETAGGSDFAAVSAAAENAVRACFGGKGLGKNLYRAKLSAAIMAVEGVENCTVTLPAADVEIDETELPVIGTVTISQAV